MRKEFLRSVAEAFLKDRGRELSGCCFVFPNKRSSLFFRKYLSERCDSPFFLPELTTVNQLFAKLSDLRSLNRITLLYRLYLSYSDAVESYDRPFDDFVYWGDMLLNDFDDIDKYLADPKALFTNISDLHEIDRKFGSEYTASQKEAIERFWGVVIESGNKEGKKRYNEESFLELWNSLYEVYIKYKESLKERGEGYEGMIYREVVRILDNAPERITGALSRYERVVFVGFNALNNCERKLFRFLNKSGNGDFYWDYFGDEIRDRDNRSSFFMESNLSEFPSSLAIDSGLPEDYPAIEVISVPSAVGQAKYMHTILDDLASDSRNGDLFNTAVVLPDERLLFPLLNSIPERIGSVNVTMGYSLSNSAVASLFSQIGRVQEELRVIDGNLCFYHVGVTALLSHPLIRKKCGERGLKIIEWIVRNNRIYISREELPGFDVIFKRAGDSSVEISDYLTAVIDYLTCTDEGENGVDRIDSEFLMEFQKCVNLLSSLDTGISSATYFRLLRQLTGSVSVPFSGEPLAGLQVMGPLETRVLDFENIVILSMNEGVYPAKSLSPSVIPYNLRRGFGLPTYEYQDSVSAYHFYRSICRARRVILMCDSRTQGLRSGEESRFIKQLEYHHGHTVVRRNLTSSVYSPKSPLTEIAKDRRIIDSLRKMRFSASSLLLYKRCPVAFYYQYVEGLSEEETVTEEVDFALFGNLYHKTMKRLYSELHGGRATADAIGLIRKERKRVDAAISEAFEEELHIKDIKGKNVIVSELIARYVSHTLRVDASLAPFCIDEMEQLHKVSWPMPSGSREVLLKGFIDRLDRCDSGYRIVDYKTGRVPVGGGIKEEHLFQLAFYMLILDLEGKIPDSSSVLLDIHYVRELYHSSNREVSLSEQEYKDYCRDLSSLFDEIFDDSLPFTMTEDTAVCDSCIFNMICNRL